MKGRHQIIVNSDDEVIINTQNSILLILVLKTVGEFWKKKFRGMKGRQAPQNIVK